MDDTYADSGCCGDDGPYYFDEQGELIEDPALLSEADLPGAGRLRPERVPGLTGPVVSILRPCSLAVVNGSWLLEFTPRRPLPVFARQVIRGPMRIEVRDTSLRISGDVYVRRLLDLVVEPEVLTTIARDEDESGADVAPEGRAVNPSLSAGLLFPRTIDGAPIVPSYPQLPKNQYSWYFRSTGVSYAGGVLSFSFQRHLWNRTSQEFVSQDGGSMRLTCRRSILVRPAGVAVMSGTATVGGQVYDVKATKTSNRYRGCAVEVDVMTGRSWPASALNQGVVRTFQNVYASSGWDVSLRVDELNVPNDTNLTMAELQTLLTTHRGSGAADPWRLWLLVGSAQGGLFGIMFDDDSVPREGAVGFADATLGNQSFIEPAARNQQLNNVPAAFLRTLIHEAGHALNLFHPKHDTHNPPIGTEIMNQTGDVMGFASPTNQYPGNATFAFAPHDHDSLVHSPDPQVRPGWKNFGWGHGSLSAGVPVPTDAAGLQVGDDAEGLTLRIDLPAEVFVGEFVTATVTLANTGDTAREVTSRLNLAEGYLRFHHVLPDGAVEQVRDVVVACGPRGTTQLDPGESLTARMQVYFTSEGVTFDKPGTHVVRAELDVDTLTTVRSNRVTVYVRTAATEAEVEISTQMLDPGVGRSLALGDFGADEEARRRLAVVAEAHHDVDTGAAAALVLANSLARRHTDIRGDATRDAAPDEAQHYLDLAMRGRSAEELVTLAATVASPVETDAPVVGDALARARRARKGKADIAAAEAVLDDFVAASPA
jgi:hypothetical protein